MDRFVKLDILPDGLQFPSEQRARISYDAAQRRLVFRGFMSKADFDRLIVLSSDWGYRRALEELFRLCTPEPTQRPSGLHRIFAAVTGRRA